jgi:hypothetical protein
MTDRTILVSDEGPDLNLVTFIEGCYESGHRAYERGNSRNPFAPGSIAYDAWSGYMDAEHEYTGFPPEDCSSAHPDAESP